MIPNNAYFPKNELIILKKQMPNLKANLSLESNLPKSRHKLYFNFFISCPVILN